MRSEQAFGKLFDSEHLFVIDCGRSEHVFEGGDAMSVALEVEYEAFYPRLTVVPRIGGAGDEALGVGATAPADSRRCRRWSCWCF